MDLTRHVALRSPWRLDSWQISHVTPMSPPPRDDTYSLRSRPLTTPRMIFLSRPPCRPALSPSPSRMAFERGPIASRRCTFELVLNSGKKRLVLTCLARSILLGLSPGFFSLLLPQLALVCAFSLSSSPNSLFGPLPRSFSQHLPQLTQWLPAPTLPHPLTLPPLWNLKYAS
jgi:hypothetical protein